MNAFSAIRRFSRRLNLDRRGAAAATLAVGSTALLGMAALATEGGVWYVAHRNAQNAADAAALAGALALSLNGTTAAVNVGTEVANLNRFQSGQNRTTVTVTPGAWLSGTFTPTNTGPNAVRVNISQAQPIGLSRVIISSEPVARVSAIASLRSNGPACSLSLRGATIIQGSSVTKAISCILASNATGRRAFEVQGTAQVDGFALRSSGECYGCNPATNANVSLSAGWSDYRPATVDPYNDPLDPAHRIDNSALPYFGDNNSNCVQNPSAGNPTTINLTPSSTRVICHDITITTGMTLNFAPGVYYFNSADLKVTGGTVTGTGVTLVFTGTPGASGGKCLSTKNVCDLSGLDQDAARGAKPVAVRRVGSARGPGPAGMGWRPGRGCLAGRRGNPRS